MIKHSDIIPIHWFGDRKAYEKSAVRVVTVGLNPSSKEFRENENQRFSTELRFPEYQKNNPKTLKTALNNYFKRNPYKTWFNSFECVLNGMDASYYGGKTKCAIHTDICSPWATDPTWSKLPKAERDKLYDEGHPEWEKLIKELKPDIIIASVAKVHIDKLGISSTQKDFCRFDLTKDGSKRKRPEFVRIYEFNGIPLINGCACQVPFGLLSSEDKEKVGEEIKKRLL